MKKLPENRSASADHKTVPAHIAAIMRKVDSNVSRFTNSRDASVSPTAETEKRGFFEKLAQPFVDLLSKL